jgi:hypothetical protein
MLVKDVSFLLLFSQVHFISKDISDIKQGRKYAKNISRSLFFQPASTA